MQEPNLLTVVEAARLLGYTTQHTRLLIRKKRLPAVKVGRDWLLERRSVDDFRIRRDSQPPLPSIRP